MSFLPILVRELRLRARGRANYWGRAAMGLLAIIVAVPPLLVQGSVFAPPMLGQSVFNAIVIAAFVFCCACCLATADTISRERRDGTLGLLFLTPIRSLDLLVAKFASNGLTCLLALVTFVPVLTIPLLAGGVGPAEIARNCLVLLGVLFLALSAGLWASARGFDRVTVVRDAVLLVITLVLGPGLAALLFPSSNLELASPIGAMIRASAASYRTSVGPYWFSVAWLYALALTVLLLAAWILRKRPQFLDDPAPTNSRAGVPPDTAGSSPAGEPLVQECSYCGGRNNEHAIHCYRCGTKLKVDPVPAPLPILLADQPTPIHWLMRRRRGLLPIVWLAALISLLHFGTFPILGRPLMKGFSSAVFWVLEFLLSAAMGVLFAWAASRFFVMVRRSGELELLLPTPVCAEMMISAQWDALKRLITGPVLVMLLPYFAWFLFIPPSVFRYNYLNTYSLFSLVFGVIRVVLSVRALCSVGLWLGFRTGALPRAVFWTVLVVEGPAHALPLAYSLSLASHSEGNMCLNPRISEGNQG